MRAFVAPKKICTVQKKVFSKIPFFHFSLIRIRTDTMEREQALQLLLLLEEQEEEMAESDLILQVALIMQMMRERQRSIRTRFKHNRLSWDGHVEMLRRTGDRGFERRYHMKENSFNKLLGILRHRFITNEVQAARAAHGNIPIIPEVVLACGLRYLGGDRYTALMDIFGISLQSAKRCVNKFLDAIMESGSDELKVKLPTTPEELKQHADDWDELSGAFQLYYGTVGAIDGWLVCINKPPLNDPALKRQKMRNQTDYFSGHYQQYGLNIQAICDAKLRFIYFCVAAPGKTNDSRAFIRCEFLQHWLQNLPEQYFLVGDNAYQLDKTMLVPISGRQKDQETNRTYNFYLSQLRIRIEMAFGRMTSKWRIFRRNLDCTLDKTSRICQVAAILHNFVIDNDGLGDLVIEPLTGGTDNNGLAYLPGSVGEADGTGDTSRRNRIIAGLVERSMVRPSINILRNDATNDGEEE